MKYYFKQKIQLIFPIMAFFLLLVLLMNYRVLSFAKEGIFSKSVYLPNGISVGLVFGASIKPNGDPSDILKDRLKVASNAYKIGKIKQIIVSGDNSRVSYNEPVAMEEYLISLGVNKDDIYLDYAGLDTYDSIYRAKHIFGVQKIVLFTQDFHLKRAMYISKNLGIITYGVQTNLQLYLHRGYNQRREIFARIKAFLDIEVNHSKPHFLGEPVNMKIVQIKNP